MMIEAYPIVILAGGLATRLRPVTETIPKALIEIDGEPFIAHQLRLLHAHGLTDVVLCLGYLGEQVEAFVGDGSVFGMNVTYSYDGEKLLGTAGAIKKALPLLADNFFVVYGDSYLTCDYLAVQQAFMAQQKLGLMTVFNNEGQWDKSNVEFHDGEIKIYDKTRQTPEMHFIDYGLGIFNKAAFDKVPNDKPFDLATVYQDLLQQKQLAAFEVSERFYEVGSFSGIDELSQIIKNFNVNVMA